MIKICFVTTVFITFRSFLKDFCEYLNATGEFDISLICADEEGLREQLPDYIHYHPVTMKRGVSISGVSAVLQMRKIFIKEQFDIVQYSTPNAAFYASIASKSASIPVRLYCQWGIRYMGFEGWKRILFKCLEKITCKNSTYIEAESHNIQNFSLSEKLYTQDRSCVVWNGSASGVNLSRFDINKKQVWRESVRSKLCFEQDDVVFAFAARLTADKGINELLSAFLKIDNPRAKLLVMGDVDDGNSLNNSLIDEAISTNRAVFTGNVGNIEQYYAASDVFVSPSYREGFGLVVIEAEAMGLPAIVSNVPGQIDAIDENVTGLCCLVKSDESLKDAMLIFLNNEELRNQMGYSARIFAENNFEQKKLFEKLTSHRKELFEG